MKKIFSNKKFLIGIIMVIILIFGSLLVFNKKEDKLKNIEDALENIFFYLPEGKYDNLNDIPDYCKISLVYGTNYLKDDKYISSDDYNTEVKKNDKKAVNAYQKDNVLKAVKNILGEHVSINFDKNNEEEYEFTLENGCGYNNDSIDLLSYNQINQYIYSYDTDDIRSAKLYVKWEKPIIDGDTVTLEAKALLPIDNGDGSYIVYADKDMSLLAGRIEKDDNLKVEIEKLYETESREYIFTLKKQGNDYIWTNYEVLDYMYNNEVILN